MAAYYNEFDPAAAAWLRELIKEGHIPAGDVDERSIKDVQPHDLRRYTQCHFFAGVGVWPAALRVAGWDDDDPVGTGSCPCQPFTEANAKALGFDDPRHLWPDWLRIIDGARTQGQRWAYRLLGEQSANAGKWVDLVRSDLEARSYAFASPDIPAAGFSEGSHRRQRFYWVVDADNTERWADLAPRNIGDWPAAGRVEGDSESGASRLLGGLGDPYCSRLSDTELGFVRFSWRGQEGRATEQSGDPPGSGADWLLCRDRGLRPVEPGSSPLAASAPERMGLLRGYGNALDLAAASQFIAAYRESLGLLDEARRPGRVIEDMFG